MRFALMVVSLLFLSPLAPAEDLADCPPKIVDASEYEKQIPFFLKFTETWGDFRLSDREIYEYRRSITNPYATQGPSVAQSKDFNLCRNIGSYSEAEPCKEYKRLYPIQFRIFQVNPNVNIAFSFDVNRINTNLDDLVSNSRGLLYLRFRLP